jgi:hypothetical protein
VIFHGFMLQSLMHTAEAQKMNPPPRCGREHFTGYIADLIDEVTNYMKFNYSLCVVGDDEYGSKHRMATNIFFNLHTRHCYLYYTILSSR